MWGQTWGVISRGQKDDARGGGLCMLSHFSPIRLCDPMDYPLSIEFSRQECWRGLPCLPPGDLPDPGIEPESLMSPALAGGFFTTCATWEAQGKFSSAQFGCSVMSDSLRP